MQNQIHEFGEPPHVYFIAYHIQKLVQNFVTLSFN